MIDTLLLTDVYVLYIKLKCILVVNTRTAYVNLCNFKLEATYLLVIFGMDY